MDRPLVYQLSARGTTDVYLGWIALKASKREANLKMSSPTSKEGKIPSRLGG